MLFEFESVKYNKKKSLIIMGTSISIDKHVSSLEDILEMPPSYFDKIKFESKISSDITQHLKVKNTN
jgi:hypothetical protein